MKKVISNRAMGKSPKKLKGFTLVELIVVMVILALLMALAIPQVTKYIDKAGEITMKSEARACYTAVQAYCVEQYEANKTQGTALQSKVVSDMSASGTLTGNYTRTSNSQIWAMANVPDNGRISEIKIEGTTVKKLVYQYGSDTSTQIIYENGKYTKKGS